MGEPLPGGSVLRRVEADRVVLWNKGREEVLTLQPSATRFLRRLDPQARLRPLPLLRIFYARYPGRQSDQPMNSSISAQALRILLFLAALVLSLFHGAVRAEEEKWQLAMNNAELRDIVEEISTILGTTVVLDPRVSGRITVMSRQALDREGVRRLFYSVLDAHNFTVIDEGDRILITPVTEAKTRAGQGIAKNATASQFITQVIELNTSSASDIAGLVRPLVSANGYVGPSVSANALVVTDTAANVNRIAQVVRQLDSGQNNQHAVVQMQHAQAADVATVMEASLGKRSADTAIQVLADARTNRLILIGPPAVRQRLIDLARRLDTPATATPRQCPGDSPALQRCQAIGRSPRNDGAGQKAGNGRRRCARKTHPARRS